MKLLSSHVAEVEYDKDNEVLTVHFRAGEIYEYTGVPEQVYAMMIQTIDPGEFFRQFVKGQYEYQRIT